MLKITIRDSAAEQRLVLEGKLTEDAVPELKSTWDHRCKSRNNCKCVVNLDGVTCIDATGKALLISMLKAGARLTAKGVYTKYLIKQLRKEGWHAGDSQRRHQGAGGENLKSAKASNQPCECWQAKEKD